MLTTREVIKTFYNALLQRLKKHRGDWNQNDPSADDYIKNRPFYTDETKKVIKLDKKYLPDIVATKSEVETAQSTANNAENTANNAENTAISARNIANSARNIANNAKTAADAANAKFVNVLTIEPTGYIDIPTDAMDDGTYQVLRLISKDQYHATSFRVTESTGLQIVVDRDGGFQSSTLNPSTVDFRAGGGGRMRLKGIDELIMNSSTAGSTKRFKITVDDSGTLTIKAITE